MRNADFGMRNVSNNKSFYVILVIVVIIIDQLTKFLISTKFSFGSYPIIENILYITLIKNTGAAFGMFKGYNFLLMLITILVIIFAGYTFFKSRDKWQDISLALILGGAVGNLIDRIRLGYVIDFIDFNFWPAFNLADSAVTVGALILFVYILMTRK